MDDDNRYAPPRAEVADAPDPPGTPQCPAVVRLAVNLTWVSLALGIPMTLFATSREPDSTIALLVTSVVLYGLAAVLNLMVAQGRHWARVVTAGLAALGLVFMLTTETVGAGPMENVLSSVVLVIDAVVVYLLFTARAAPWFRPRR